MKLGNKLVFLISIPSIFLSLIIAKENYNSFPVKSEGALTERLKIINEPFLTRNSLGSELFTNGLTVTFDDEIIEDYVINYEDYDKNNLGTQEITISYQTFTTSFDVFVTNEFALVGDQVERGVFVSNVTIDEGQLMCVELFNATYKSVFLTDYSFTIENEKQTNNIPLGDFPIESNDALTISFAEDIIDDINVSLEDFDDFWNLKLLKEAVVLDNFSTMLIAELNPESNDVANIKRHPSILKPNNKIVIDEWYSTTTPFDNSIPHVINENVISYEDQAKAFARYVMFGDGMFASGRVEEAFLALRTEFEFMHPASINYFLDNPKVTVHGYNEDNKYVGVTFRNAYERINMLAVNSGHTSFINVKRPITLNFSKSLLIVLLTSVSLFGYFVLMHIKNYQKKV